MTVSTARPPAAPHRPVPDRPAPRTPRLGGVAAGLAVLLAAAPVSAVVQGTGWLVSAAVAVAVVVAMGLVGAVVPALRSAGATAVLQVAGLLVVLTLRFSDDGVLGVLPGPAALGDLGALLVGAGAQIDVGVAPVTGTPQIVFLVTASIGLLAVAVHLSAVAAAAPAAGGVPLLAAFAVPAALADDLLPWWTLAAAAAAFGLLLLAPDGNRRQLPGGVALVAAGGVVALLVGLLGSAVGTAGRFDPGGTGGGSGAIGLSPFTALRGQLEQSTPTELFRVTGLRTPTYLRALTLAEYDPATGWRAVRPAPGVDAAGPLPPVGGAGTVADVRLENLGFRDYWLPLYGLPLATAGLEPGAFAYDPASSTAYSARPAEQDEWTQRAFLPAPTAGDLRSATGGTDPGALYSSVAGIDPRVVTLAQEVTAQAGTPFDRALALQEYFTGPESLFTYDLATAPPAGDDALVEFLTVGRVGYCEQFASAMAAMLRAVGVPARVAVGFTAGSPDADTRLVSTSDAHAWVEAWFPGIGWTTFDPTPLTDGRAIVPPYVEEARSGGGAGTDAAPAPTPAAPQPAVPTPDGAAQQVPEAGDGPDAPAPAGGGVPLWPVLLGVLVLAVAAAPLARRAATRRRRTAAARAGGAGAADAAWSELLAESTDRGVPVPATDTVRGAARRLVREHRLDAGAQDALRVVVTAVEADRYGGEATAPGRLADPLAAVSAAVAAGSPLRIGQRLLPASLRADLRRRSPARPAPADDEARPTKSTAARN